MAMYGRCVASDHSDVVEHGGFMYERKVDVKSGSLGAVNSFPRHALRMKSDNGEERVVSGIVFREYLFNIRHVREASTECPVMYSVIIGRSINYFTPSVSVRFITILNGAELVV